MALLNPTERAFLDVFLHEASTPPFKGPATDALHSIDVWHDDIIAIAWAYEQDAPRRSFDVGHSSDVAPPLPWKDRDSALKRNKELKRIWESIKQSSVLPAS